MKKQTVFKIADGRQLMLCLTIRDMMALEQEIGKSLFSVIAEMGHGSLRSLDLRYTIAALRWALPKPQEEDAVSIARRAAQSTTSIRRLFRRCLRRGFLRAEKTTKRQRRM